MAKFKKTIVFEPGYNHLGEEHPRGGPGGQHGMHIRFNLIGPDGAVQLNMNTSWTPLGTIDKNLPRGKTPEVCHVDYWDGPGTFGIYTGLVRAPSGSCIGLHSPKPFAHDPDADFCTASACDVLPGGVCYFDAAYSAADKVVKHFITSGEKAVWKDLRGWYKKYFEPKEE